MKTKTEIKRKIKDIAELIVKMDEQAHTNPIALARLEAGRNWLMWAIDFQEV